MKTHLFVVVDVFILIFVSLTSRERCHDSEEIPGLPASSQSLHFAAGEAEEREVTWKTATKTMSMNWTHLTVNIFRIIN